jgi:hypothetical protein
MFGKTKRFAAVALIFLAGCDTLTGTQPEKALWNALDIENYDFVYQVSCFCGIPGPNPVKLSVRKGQVTAAAPVGSFTGSIPALSTYPTIDSLFVILEAAEKKTPAGVEVDFDPTYHYPTKIAIDPVKNAADDEVTYTVESFVPVIEK